MNNIKNTANNDLQTIWIKIPYFSDKGDQLLKSLKTKLKRNFTSLIVQVVIIVTLEKPNAIYAQEQKNMSVVIKEVPFTTVLGTAVVAAILKIFSVSIMIPLIKHYLVSSPSKVTPK